MKKLGLLAIILLAITGIAFAAAVESPPIRCFEDDFEARACGSYVYLGDPIIGMWAWPTPNFLSQVVNCDIAIGEKSMAIKRFNGGAIHAIPRPYFRFEEGMTAIFEVDVYAPSGVGAAVSINASGSSFYPCSILVDPERISTRWLIIGDGSLDTGVEVVFDTWNHIKIEMYDDMTFSVWLTPQGQDTIQLTDRFGWNPTVTLPFTPRMIPNAQPPDNAFSYYDNLYTAWIDHYAQGYPAIKATDQEITVDGNIDLVTEWADAVKIANKPSGGLGNFRNYWLSNQDNQGLQDITALDLYMTHDDEFFYLAGIMTNAAAGNPEDTDESYIEAVFSFVYDDPMLTDVSYYLAAHATGSDPDEGTANIGDSGLAYNGKLLGNGTGAAPPENVPLDPNVASPEIWYTLTEGVFKMEMKIPFVALKEFTGPEPGKLVHLSFNARDAGIERSTSNPTREIRPFTYYWSIPYTDAPVVGFAFESCGDELHPLPLGDLNKDCRVNLNDLAIFSDHWLESTQP